MGWFKRGVGPEPLDLTRHGPAEFEGKLVTLDGREYLVGRSFKQGDQGHAHLLIDRRSGECRRLIQIRVEYMHSPAVALSASLLKAKMTAELKERMASSGTPAPIPTITVREAHGGSFEVHELNVAIR